MARYIKLLILIVLSSFTFYAGSAQVSALSGADFQAGRIIDDAVFFNRDSLTGSNIQAFMNSKVPVCDTWHAPGYGQNPPFTCLKDYRENTPSKAGEYGLCNPYAGGNKSSTEMIYDVSQICGINPKILLVLLQKEQSLVGDTWPLNSTLIKATGYGCPDSVLPANVDGNQNGCYDEYEGFFNQIYMAARQYKKYARDAYQYNFLAGRNNYIQYHPNPACGGTNVYIQNQATAGLYNYTPYQPNGTALSNIYGSQNDGCSAYGNRNFWRMFNDWFGSPYGTSVVRTPSNPTYFLITNNQRFAIPNGDILYAYGLDRTPLSVVSDNYLYSFADGGTLSTIFTVPGSGTVYLADGGRKYGIASGAYCTRWGLACGNSSVQKEIGTDITSLMPDAGVLKEIMANQGTLYLMENGTKLPFFSPQALTDKGYTFNNAVSIVSFTNAIRPMGLAQLENNSFVKFAASDAIYLYSNNLFYTLPDIETYINWLSPQARTFVDTVSSYNQNIPASSGTLGSYVRFQDNVPYVLDAGAKVALGTEVSNWPAVTSYNGLTGYSALLNTKATLSSQSTIRTPSGGIYKVTSQTKRPFADVSDYFGLGYTVGNLVQFNSNSLSSIANGTTMFSEGRLVKKIGSDTIYATGPSGKLYGLSSMGQITQFKFTSNAPPMNASTSALYPTTEPLLSTVTIGGQYFVIREGEKFLIPPSLHTAYGVSGMTFSTFSAGTFPYLNQKNLDRFIQAQNGTIYYVDAGTKRPISSYGRFSELGGNTFNTHIVPNDFLSLIPTGTTI